MNSGAGEKKISPTNPCGLPLVLIKLIGVMTSSQKRLNDWTQPKR